MEIPVEEVAPEANGATVEIKRLLLTHFKESQKGVILPAENPEVL
jgi:hypothetical protein